MNGNRQLAVGPQEAARMLGIGRSLVYEMIKSGDIPAVRLGARRLLVPIEALEKMLRNRMN